MNLKVASSYASRQAYEEATFTFILLVEDVLKSYRWNEVLLVATSIHSVLCAYTVLDGQKQVEK